MKKIYLILTLIIGVLHTSITFGQVYFPGGTSCATAVPIPVGGTYYTINDGPGSYHWYSFVAPCDGELNVTQFGAENESDRRIYTGVCGSLELQVVSDWAMEDAEYIMDAGESVYFHVSDTWESEAQFSVEFTTCPGFDSLTMDIGGTVYYDLNENGVMDIGELPVYPNIIKSEPFGIFAMTGFSGYYNGSIAMLDDGIYEIYPEVGENWKISSDSLIYTLNVNDDFVDRDSLDFGIAPDTIIYEVEAFTTMVTRCNDTVACWLHWTNEGTTIASGLIHLELGDGAYYVSSEFVPDSIVGQNIYWSYEGLLFDEYRNELIRVGTPEGGDTVINTLTYTIVFDGEVMFSETNIDERVITCGYDPNDKTPDPLGVGEFGYIAPDTETIEYLVRFQNTGTDTAINVVIKDQFDENLDWNSFELLGYSHDIELAMSVDGEISFIFNDIMLPDSNVNEIASHGFVKYKVDLLPGLPLETSIFNTAYIYFDLNPAVVTNTAINTLHVVIDDASIDELASERHVLVYPNPFTETTTVYFGEDLTNHSIQIVDPLGKLVYSSTTLTGNKIEIEASSLTEGMYILLLIENESNQVISNAKLMVK
jgi:hypothetical protein